jgi:hypothetical protein
VTARSPGMRDLHHVPRIDKCQISLSLSTVIVIVFLILSLIFLPFSMLYNPHIGIADNLDRLYEMAKLMAGCDVPQGMAVYLIQSRR